MRASHSLRLSTALAVLLLAKSALAWNDAGHKTIALIAWEDLTPTARARVTDLLRKHPQYALHIQTKGATGEDLEIQDFMTAATWADIVRTTTPENRPYDHPLWHTTVIPFITGNLPADKRPSPWPTEWKPGDAAENGVQALQQCEAEIRDTKSTDAQKAVAMAWIVHLTGDMQQPLHTTSWYSEEFPSGDGDKRGNFTFINTGTSKTNLHAYWDNVLGSYRNLETTRQVAAQLKKDFPRGTLADALKVTDFKTWLTEGHELAKTVAYMDGKIPHGLAQRDAIPEVPKTYLDEAKALQRKRITLGGYRLADQLNRLFDPR